MMLEIALYFSIGVLCTVFAGAALVIIWNDYEKKKKKIRIREM